MTPRGGNGGLTQAPLSASVEDYLKAIYGITGAGGAAAIRTVRRHRVIEAYLSKALGYKWDSVHDEAERLEHAASDDLVDRMAAAIGEPGVDPHGAPIPTRDGAVEETRSISLADADAGYIGSVVSV